MAKYTNIDLSKYSGGYKATDREKKAEQQKIKAENAVANYGDFIYSNQGAYDTLMDSILNRKKFSYDMNADALYQQYKNQYTALGKLAMQDTIGQASALTGGYGNSYATSAGSQAYQNYLNQLNERVPELMQLALSTYNAEGDRLYNNMSLMQSDRNTEYGEWADKYNRLLGDRTYYGDNYNTVHSQDYAAWADNRSYDQNQYWNEYNAGYQAERDAVADSQWQQQFAYQKERDKVADSQWQKSYDLSASKSSGGSGGSGGYTEAEMQKAASSAQTSTFKASVMTKREFARRSQNGITVGGKTMRFDNYTQYIDAVAAAWYKEGKLSETEVAYIKGYYGID